MDARVFDSALSAAARVAFSTALVSACSSDEGNDTTSTEPLNASSDTTLTSAVAPAPNLKRRCDAGTPAADASVPAYTCTERGIQDLYTDRDSGREIDPAKVTSDVVACCESLLSTAEASSELSNVWLECCFDVPHVKGGAWPYTSRYFRACTPWGPPVPPAMPNAGPRPEAMAEVA